MKTALQVVLVLAALFAGYRFLSRDHAAGPAYAEDAAAAIKAAAAEARAGRKRVLVDVGGADCIWCVRMHRFIQDDPEIRGLSEAGFVTVHVDFRRNVSLVNGYAPVSGTPHFFVLADDGRLLHSQETESLESGQTYDRAKVLEFFKTWSP